jgi:alpha-galactosidase
MMAGSEMNRRQWLEQAGIVLVAGLTGCKSGGAPGNHPARVSSVDVGVNRGGPVILQTASAEFRVLPSGNIQAFLRKQNGNLTIEDSASGAAGSYLVSGGKQIANFTFDFGQSDISDVKGKIGALGKRIEMPASSPGGIHKILAVEVYDDFPNLAVVSETYKNLSTKDLPIDRVVANRHRLNASLIDRKTPPYRMWSFQGSSYKWGENIIEEIPAKFSQPNLMGGPTPKGLGGGIPVVAFWTDKVGIGMGHLELLPLLLSLPVKLGSGKRVEASMELEPQTVLKPGDSYSLPQSFISIFEGDFYKPLRMYSRVLQREGWDIPKPGKQAYNINWCGWGYEQDVTRAQMLGTIPKLKELGIKWATLDYRWFNNFGDWEPREDTFPGQTMKQLADEFHKQGFYIQLWWQPLAVDDGKGKHLSWKHAVTSRLAKEHPDWLILDKDGKHARLISPVCDVASLCPALPEVQRYFVKLVQRFIRDWGYDGSKMDSVFSAPPCYNPKHNHKSPQDSILAMPRVIQAIFETSRALKPYSVTQICPCGAPPNFAWLPYMNQAVTADPVGSIQVRRRIKMYKALLGPQAAVYGDHVELTKVRFADTDREIDVGEDFASTVGTGGVVGTKFVWPDPGPHFKNVYLTPAKEKIWKKWTDIYNREMLSSGTFLDLYNYGYDFPEAYAIRKDGKMFYAFYAPNPRVAWRGQVELRGLDPGRHRVYDYENQKDLGIIGASNPRLKTEFRRHLLLEVSKV